MPLHALAKSKEGARPKDDAADRLGNEQVEDDVTVDADEQMLAKLDHGSRIWDADPKRFCASAASAANVTGARESEKEQCAEFEYEEGTVSFCDSSAGEKFPI